MLVKRLKRPNIQMNADRNTEGELKTEHKEQRRRQKGQICKTHKPDTKEEHSEEQWRRWEEVGGGGSQRTSSLL